MKLKDVLDKLNRLHAGEDVRGAYPVIVEVNGQQYPLESIAVVPNGPNGEYAITIGPDIEPFENTEEAYAEQMSYEEDDDDEDDDDRPQEHWNARSYANAHDYT